MKSLRHLVTAVALLCPAILSAERVPFKAGDLELALIHTPEGFRLEHLFDSSLSHELLAKPPLPLFTATARQAGSSNDLTFNADAGWSVCSIKTRGRHLDLNWSRHTNAALQGISVNLAGTADARASAIRWTLKIINTSKSAGLWRVTFPQVAVADLGTNAAVFFPRGSGEVQTGGWSRPFTYHGNYPDGWCAMQFMAAYAPDPGRGLYVATHDPWGSTKELLLKSDPGARSLRLSFEHPAPNMGVPGTGFILEGEAVWQLLPGDWFDAATIYRNWAKDSAQWWPKLGREGRTDTPLWTRQLSAWAMTGGATNECVPRVQEFQQYLGIPAGFHWYNWHQIPFDNDYPHYFPPKEGFAEGVARLKGAGVYPMPYINGRLWDSHDHGTDDFQFTSLALPAVTKKDDGSPYLETYGSKETNGQPVRLGVMCPSTPLWRNTVSNIVIGLLRECGTSAVYIDQIAAAAPKLCMDPKHGHPLGGGHWWTESYWKMLHDIRRAMPRETMLTTECNAEPYIHRFDAYLTWHWQYDNQVPAFPAVYGGALQMFGRAYRGGATKDLALRMKAAQQLVFGEQLGWLDPNIVKEPQNADFFCQLARLRSTLGRYFYAGQMARPPKLVGSIPKLRADWQWSGEWWVTTDAILTGAWTLPREHRLVLLFVNASDEPVTTTVLNDARSWALREAQVPTRVHCSADSESSTAPAKARFGQPLTLAPRQAQAWEFGR